MPSLQAATVMGLSTSSVFPSRWYATVHGGMGMQSFFSLDLAWPGPSQTLARIGPWPDSTGSTRLPPEAGAAWLLIGLFPGRSLGQRP